MKSNDPAQFITKDQLEASLCRQSFYDFFLRFWSILSPEILVPNWHIKYLCDEIQIVMERVFARLPKEYDLVVNVPPGSTKSTIFSQMAPAWCWTRDPSLKTICGSHTMDLSLDFGSKFYAVVNSEKYKRLFPEVVLSKDAMGSVQNTRRGERRATATLATITGFHAHGIFIDDPLDPEGATSDLKVVRANRWMDGTLRTRMINKTITPIILIQQRLHQDDPSGHMLAKEHGTPVKHICLPAELTDRVRPRSLRRNYANGLLDPVRLSKKTLQDAEQDMTPYMYAGQYQQHPVPDENAMFLVQHLTIEDVIPKIINRVRYWDKAGTSTKQNKRAAWTVGLDMGVDINGKFWVLDVVRGRWEANERERMIKLTAQRDGPRHPIAIEREPGSGGKESAEATVKNLVGYSVRIDRPVGEKEERADPFSAQVNGNNVGLLRGNWNKEYIEELRYFPNSRYKDQVDASSGAFAMLVGKRRVVGGIGVLKKYKHGFKIANLPQAPGAKNPNGKDPRLLQV